MRLLSGALRSASTNPTFVKTDLVQRTLLTLGSGMGSILDPSRDDLISAFGDLTSELVLPRLRERMRADPEGMQILHDKPMINSEKLGGLDRLAQMPSNTFGCKYAEFMRDNYITPDSRRPVLFIRDAELAYVLLRYRQIHDFTHCILGKCSSIVLCLAVRV